MTAEEFKKEWRDDATLQVGQKVTVYWTNSGRAYRASATIHKLHAKSVKVKLLEPISGYGGEDDILYPVGHEITVPRIINISKWTFANRVSP